jgi:hypothetical protein
MALAADLHCLAQVLDSAPEVRLTHADAVRQLSQLCDSMRDALYELYCDAAHPHAADVAGFLGALEPSVRESYGWCSSVVSLLTQVASELRAEPGPDWSAAKATYKAVSEKRPRTSPEAARSLVCKLAIDFESPVEPLRNLPVNLDHLADATAGLDEALAKRFAG